MDVIVVFLSLQFVPYDEQRYVLMDVIVVFLSSQFSEIFHGNSKKW